MVSYMKDKRRATVKEIQRLAGTLNFLCCVVQPGRAFTRRMYSKFAGITDKQACVLRQYHHVPLDLEFRNDCQTWRLFLLNPLSFTRPMVDLDATEIHTTDVDFYTDASLSVTKGIGCVFGTEYTWGFGSQGTLKTTNQVLPMQSFTPCVWEFSHGKKSLQTCTWLLIVIINQYAIWSTGFLLKIRTQCTLLDC